MSQDQSNASRSKPRSWRAVIRIHPVCVRPDRRGAKEADMGSPTAPHCLVRGDAVSPSGSTSEDRPRAKTENLRSPRNGKYCVRTMY
jgi:hypothetical protein